MKIKELIQKMYHIVVSIQKDDLLHYIFGLLITQVMCVVLKICNLLSYGGCVAAAVIAIIVVYFKEIYDENHKGHSCELPDIVYGVAGSVTGMLMIMLCI